MSDSERDPTTDPDPAPEEEAPPSELPDGPLTPAEVDEEPAYEPENEELKRVKGG